MTFQQERSLDLLTITDPGMLVCMYVHRYMYVCMYVCMIILDNLVSDVRKKIIFITSRIHPGETPSSYVCRGI